MLFSWFELLLLVGVVQGSITSFLLFKERSYRLQHRLLGTAIACFAAICIKIVIYSIGLESRYRWLEYFPLAFETATPPLLYLYCLSLTEAKFKLTKRRVFHFIPFAFFMFYALAFYSNILLVDSNQAREHLLNIYHLELVKSFEDYFTVASILTYLLLASFVLKKLRLQADNYTSDNSHGVFSWLRSIQVLMFVLIILLISNMIIDRAGLTLPDSINHWKIYFLYLAGVIYYLGFRAVKSPFILKQEALNSPRKSEITEHSQKAKERDLATKIENTIKEKTLYLSPTFCIQELSELIQVNQKTVSQVINRYLGCTFRDLINQNRIEMAKKLLLSNKDNGVSILSQALECGFNSEASFYRVFKKHTGKSPTQYIKALNKESFED